MATNRRRYIDVIAVVAVLVVVAVVVWVVEPGFKQEPELPKPALVKEPDRPRVKSISELPDMYPSIDTLLLSGAGRPIRNDLLEISPQSLGAVQVRHLGAYASTNPGEVFVSPDCRHALLKERTPAGTHRAALWDLSSGKLLRLRAAR
jgi:hypothetical protein